MQSPVRVLHSGFSPCSMPGRNIVTLWNGEVRPAEEYAPKLTTPTVGGDFGKPVFVNVSTGTRAGSYAVRQLKLGKI